MNEDTQTHTDTDTQTQTHRHTDRNSGIRPYKPTVGL
jgi:hypothetical protein